MFCTKDVLSMQIVVVEEALITRIFLIVFYKSDSSRLQADEAVVEETALAVEEAPLVDDNVNDECKRGQFYWK